MSPSYRSLPPTTSPKRYIPKLSDVVAGNLTTQWETVLTQGGAMNMSLTVRDNANGGGQNHIDKMVVTVDANSGPFEVLSQATNVTWTVGTTETITWNVSNTASPPVSTSNVDIYLSLDGGTSFWWQLASGVPNNGSATISVPFSSTTTNARIMVRGAGNIFYAVNKSDFTIFSPTNISGLAEEIVNIYPNPTNGLLNLDFYDTSINKISISDVHGKIIYLDNNISSPSVQLNLSNFSNGIYMLHIQSEASKRVYKVIKQ